MLESSDRGVAAVVDRWWGEVEQFLREGPTSRWTCVAHRGKAIGAPPIASLLDIVTPPSAANMSGQKAR